MSLTIQSGGSVTIQGGSGGGGGAISAVDSATCPTTTVADAPSTFGNMPTNAAVTLTTGTSVLVTLSGFAMKVGASGYMSPFWSVAVSGATTMAASDDNSYRFSLATQYDQRAGSRTFKLSGLTAGANTFTLKYRLDGTDKNVAIQADITVMALA